MLFHQSLVAAVCFMPLALAGGVQFTEYPSEIKEGKPVTFKWAGDPETPTTITLSRGEAENLHREKILTAEGEGNSFTWTPDGSLPEDGDDYALQIQQGDAVNYSGGHIKVSHDNSKIPPAKGPSPKADNDPAQKDNKNALGTSPDLSGKNNNNSTSTNSSSSSSTHSTMQKDKVDGKTGAASFQEHSLRLILGAGAVAFFLNQ